MARTRWIRRHPRSRPLALGPRLGRAARLVSGSVVRGTASRAPGAGGGAVGVWLGVFPTFGLAIPVAYVLAWLLKLNKGAALAGSLIMNPLTTPFFWVLSAVTGAALTGTDWRVVYAGVKDEKYLFTFSRTALIYLAGNVVVATACAVLAYILAFLACRARDRRRAAKAAGRTPIESN
jgi:uncharacterized protein (DUF2062 family)